MRIERTNEPASIVREPADLSYVLLTAAYNEEAYIKETIRSVAGQVLRPRMWVIVSDGSTDRTDKIVQQYAKKHKFIHFVRREKDGTQGFASKVFALRAAFQRLEEDASPFIGHLDGDVRLAPLYFHDLLEKMAKQHELGIAGGWYCEQTPDGCWEPRYGNSTRSIPGGIQMFRRECYNTAGELLPVEYGGEDWYAEITARMHGWKVRSFPELKVHHLRPTGTRDHRLRYCYRAGMVDFAFGSHPLFEIAKVARMIATPPYLVRGLARMLGFLAGHISGERMVDPSHVVFLQREQLGRLRSFLPSLRRGQLDG